MKGIKPIFAVCLAMLGLCPALADDADTAARAATRRGATNTVSAPRQKTSAPAASANNPAAVSRTNAATVKQSAPARERTTVGTRTTAQQSARTTANVQPRATTVQNAVVNTNARAILRDADGARTTTVAPRTTTGTAARTATQPRTPVRAATTAGAARRAISGATVSRAATADDIKNRDYKKCREIYYNCMDEFCANKDSQLKRCACSSRIHEFDKVKNQLAQVEDKMLDFNQRLLTVNMDKEDAAALNKATEGELAFQQKDTSQSKKLLDEISKKLNTSFNDSNFNQALGTISLSLNVDAAFDSVDSLRGAGTTAKSGTELYRAALPVCREMVLEICDADELTIAESGYQMMIEQDCNTVAKSYETQTDLARDKIREGSALLDMSRLDIYQKRNSDDILTCKSKMLDMLTDSTVCGANMEKCLDTTGRYIDPSTGEAFLTMDLANLGTLITRPDVDQSWTSAPGNQLFVSFLNTKKKFLQPAMENCQDVADYVWDEFIEDALAQIKLAQEDKLEEMRQSCTTLTTQCLSDTAKSLQDFDARALSTFGVAADKTVNAMCADIRNACTALLDTTDKNQEWAGGMTEIATDKTYETIMQTCREVGRACIIQACKSISGNFGLCENIQTSINRKSIINRTSCWKDVKECVESTGTETLARIFNKDLHDYKLNTKTPTENYTYLYGNVNTDKTGAACTTADTSGCVLDICTSECQDNNGDTNECRVCRLAERIWGNCEAEPVTQLDEADQHNKIRIPKDKDTETLLSWFAKNTGTQSALDSCRDTTCGIGFVPQVQPGTDIITCISEANLDSLHQECLQAERIYPTESLTKGVCCNNPTDSRGNCCTNAQTQTIGAAKLCVNTTGTTVLRAAIGAATETGTAQSPVSLPAVQTSATNSLICLGTISYSDENEKFPTGQTVKCSGKYLLLQTQGSNTLYLNPMGNTIQNYYKPSNTSTCTYKLSGTQWGWYDENDKPCTQPTVWFIGMN